MGIVVKGGKKTERVDGEGFLSARWGSPDERKKAARRARVWAMPLPELNNYKFNLKHFQLKIS